MPSVVTCTVYEQSAPLLNYFVLVNKQKCEILNKLDRFNYGVNGSCDPSRLDLFDP